MRILFLLLFFTTLVSACAPTPMAIPATTTRTAIVSTRVATPSRTPTSAAAISTPPTSIATTFATFSPTDTPTSTSTPTLAPTVTPTPTMLGGCAEIWQAGFYKMYADFKTTSKRFDCMIVQASDVVIDCDGHTIEGLNKQGHGFWIRKYGFPSLQAPNNIEIRNCKVSNARDGVFAEAGTNLYIHHNDFSNNYDDTDKRRFGDFLGLKEGGGIRLNQVQGARIEYNTANNSAIGFDVRDSRQVVVRNNTAINNSAWGINLLNTSDSQILNNTLRDNVRYCVWGNGTVGPGCDAGGIILQDGSSRDVVRENTLSGQNGNGIFIKAHGTRCGDDNRIENNKIVDALYNAVEFSFCKGNQVIGNEISGSYDAVWFGFSTGTEIRNNIIRNMNNHGIISYNSRDSNVTGNQISNAREGIYFYWDKWDPKQFYFLPPNPNGFPSQKNAITDNTLRDNVVAGIHLSNSTQNSIANNSFANNGKNVWIEGKDEGNVVAGR